MIFILKHDVQCEFCPLQEYKCFENCNVVRDVAVIGCDDGKNTMFCEWCIPNHEAHGLELPCASNKKSSKFSAECPVCNEVKEIEIVPKDKREKVGWTMACQKCIDK